MIAHSHNLHVHLREHLQVDDAYDFASRLLLQNFEEVLSLSFSLSFSLSLSLSLSLSVTCYTYSAIHTNSCSSSNPCTLAPENKPCRHLHAHTNAHTVVAALTCREHILGNIF